MTKDCTRVFKFHAGSTAHELPCLKSSPRCARHVVPIEIFELPFAYIIAPSRMYCTDRPTNGSQGCKLVHTRIGRKGTGRARTTGPRDDRSNARVVQSHLSAAAVLEPVLRHGPAGPTVGRVLREVLDRAIWIAACRVSGGACGVLRRRARGLDLSSRIVAAAVVPKPFPRLHHVALRTPDIVTVKVNDAPAPPRVAPGADTTFGWRWWCGWSWRLGR